MRGNLRRAPPALCTLAVFLTFREINKTAHECHLPIPGRGYQSQVVLLLQLAACFAHVRMILDLHHVQMHHLRCTPRCGDIRNCLLVPCAIGCHAPKYK